jgi:superfamily II DNA or RNA helicase
MKPLLYREQEDPVHYALLRSSNDFGVEELDLLRPPARFWSDGGPAPAGAKLHVDGRRLRGEPTPATQACAAHGASGATVATRSALERLRAWFLICEDPQHRLEVQPVAALAHQTSVVEHILSKPDLNRVMLADEVGLGKTVEAGLLLRRLLAQNARLRVLYLAPARLVRNVRNELDRLELGFRSWVASGDRDATLKDSRIVASIHRASLSNHQDALEKESWDIIIADECHHLSDWAPGGGAATSQYELVKRLVSKLNEHGRLLLMSGTPHQGHADRFRNLLRLLQGKGETESALSGRVIYRTKDLVHDWNGQPLFPGRKVNPPIVFDLGPRYQNWLASILEFFEPARTTRPGSAQRRAAGWRAGQALQWATSSVQAGLGYLIRQAIRGKISPARLGSLNRALCAIRPYRMGSPDETPAALLQRMADEISHQLVVDELDDIEEQVDEGTWKPDASKLEKLLAEGAALAAELGDRKWDLVYDQLIEPAAPEKVVLFAQPIETVTAFAAYLERRMGRRPSLIIGNQSDAERSGEVASFWRADGPRCLVSSRAGGEGLNLQVARRLVHLDVPWNPMDLEQRIGRVHRFMSRRTILVDTLVAKNSREVDTYSFARQKLESIASTMVPPDRFDALFSRVMALVPPEELQEVMGAGPVGPLTTEEQQRVAALVTAGFKNWKGFHETYAKRTSEIQELDPGQVDWRDLASFAEDHLDAKEAPSFSALRFEWKDGEIVESPTEARVLFIDGKPYTCEPTSGMPVVSSTGTPAAQLGTNTPVVADKLRRMAFTATPCGAAFLKLSSRFTFSSGECFVLAAVRQTVRWEQSAHNTLKTTLHLRVVHQRGNGVDLEGKARGEAVRQLLAASVRREPTMPEWMKAALPEAEEEFLVSLRRPSAEDRQASLVHAVTPLLAAVLV